MPRASIWFSALGSSFLIAGGMLAVEPYRPAATVQAEPPGTVSSDDRETQALLSQLTALSESIMRNSQSPHVYQQQIQQGDLMLQIAVRCKQKERDHWMCMAVDAYHTAMVGSPDNEHTAQNRLFQLRSEIIHTYPGCAVATYAAKQEIQADYLCVLNKNGEKPALAQEHRCKRLEQFAMDNPKDAEAPKLVNEAAHTYETLGKTEEARRCYRYLADNYATLSEGRKAGGSLWRLGMTGEPVCIQLPLVYPTPDQSENEFSLVSTRGKVVVVYFWSSKCPQVEEDLQALKHLTDRFQYQGLEVVFVNLDDEAETARGFLAGRLTSGVHVHQKGGLGSAIAEHYGLQSLPQAFLVARDGSLIHHSLQVSQVEMEVAAQMPHFAKEKTLGK
jgi:thiol-disulfide isomerase/thioredoxin